MVTMDEEPSIPVAKVPGWPARLKAKLGWIVAVGGACAVLWTGGVWAVEGAKWFVSQSFASKAELVQLEADVERNAKEREAARDAQSLRLESKVDKITELLLRLKDRR